MRRITSGGNRGRRRLCSTRSGGGCRRQRSHRVSLTILRDLAHLCQHSEGLIGCVVKLPSSRIDLFPLFLTLVLSPVPSPTTQHTSSSLFTSSPATTSVARSPGASKLSFSPFPPPRLTFPQNSYVGCTGLLAGALVATFASGKSMLMAGRSLSGTSCCLRLAESC